MRLDTVDTAFAVTVDTGPLETEGRILITSLRRVYPDATIVAFVPDGSIEQLSSQCRDLLREETTVVRGEIPIPDYPISALLKAFVEAEERTDAEYLVALDTDTIALNPIAVPARSGESTWVRPAEVGAQYWCSATATDDWRTLYRHFDKPERHFQRDRTATVDHRRIPPYWNSGVVITTDRSLPQEWLEITVELFENPSLPVSRHEFFIDQISLALALASRTSVDIANEMNYPLGGLTTCPPDTAHIHYGDIRNLSRIPNPGTRAALEELGVSLSVSPSAFVRSFLDLFSTKSGLFLNYEQKEAVRSVVRKVAPQAIVDA